ncbi:DUF2517 family protein [Shigella sonnei]|uniref:DUF2517 family protein n=1 Tax=Shigella sonnei TaxID=624 RepID=UPI002432533A|nr:DUF2517 family protein [Shigella sonnei]MDG5904180.1 DUF2517 family protein [Shigella sonnei]
MELYREYPAWLIFLRRTYAVAAGVLALPFMLFWKDRARFYSYLHRVWSKTSETGGGWHPPQTPTGYF